MTAPREADSAVAADEPAPAAMGPFYAFRYPNYRLLWAGNAFTSVAMWIQGTTMGWIIYDLTGSGALLGSLSAVRILPTLVLTPLAGMASDRISRNLIVAVSQLAMTLFTLVLAFDIAFGWLEVWHLFVFAALGAATQSFNMPARQTMVFDVVPRAVIPNAAALSNLAFSISRTVGSFAGGAMIVAFGAANNFFVQSAAYFSVMITVLMMRLPKRTAPSRPRDPLWRELTEGYRFAIGDPQARLLFLMVVINPLFLIPLHLGLLPIFAKDVFGGGGNALGITLASIGAGGLVGGFITASLNRIDRRGLAQLIAVLIYSMAQGLFSIVAGLTGEIWPATAFLFIGGAAEAMYLVTNQTVVQLLAPEHLRGRLTSALQITFILNPLGSLFAGTMADIVGAPAVGAFMSLCAFVLAAGILVFSPRMRNLRLSRLQANTEAAR